MIYVGEVELSEEIDYIEKTTRIQFWGPGPDVDRLVYAYCRDFGDKRFRTRVVQHQLIEDGWIIAGVVRKSFSLPAGTQPEVPLRFGRIQAAIPTLKTK